MDPQDYRADERRLRAAIREYENARYNVEHGAPIYRAENQLIIDNIEPYL